MDYLWLTRWVTRRLLMAGSVAYSWITYGSLGELLVDYLWLGSLLGGLLVVFSQVLTRFRVFTFFSIA